MLGDPEKGLYVGLSFRELPTSGHTPWLNLSGKKEKKKKVQTIWLEARAPLRATLRLGRAV